MYVIQNRQRLACCAACQQGHMGAADPGDFQSFLADNPDLAQQVRDYQSANPSDPLLQQVYYNAITNTVGPTTYPYQETGYDPSNCDPGMSGNNCGRPQGSTTPATFLIFGAVAIGVLFLLDSGGRRR